MRIRNSPASKSELEMVSTLKRSLWFFVLLVTSLAFLPSVRAGEPGVALALVYDTSGSMMEPVRDRAGRNTPKYLIANRALTSIIDRLQAVATNTTGGTPLRMEAGLFIFNNEASAVAVPFGPFNAAALRRWTKKFSQPMGPTPLGEAVRAAGQAVLKSSLSRKHILVITDGINTAGADPSSVIPRLRNDAAKANATVEVHFVAFDVAARVFDPVKKLGATVLGAGDELQLNTQLSFILEEKILLEAEEPAKPAKK